MGREKRKSVQALAGEGAIDLDEALVLLWDAGFDDVISPDDTIGPRDLNRARRALGLATRRELQSAHYWMKILDIDAERFSGLLFEMGVNAGGTKLAKKTIGRLKGYAAHIGVDPASAENATEPPEAATAAREFIWETPGHAREPQLLSEEQVCAIHFALVEDFRESEDPIDPPGVRSGNLLGSAIYRPHTSIGGERKYATLETAAAALLHSLVLDHPFHNGNKRTALVSFLVFLEENGLFLDCSQDELFKLVLQVAQHRMAGRERANRDDREVLAIARWLCERSRFVEKGERLIPWRRLRRILTAYGCDLDFPGGVGNRINVTREREVRTFVGRRKSRTLSTQVFYGDEGREVQVDTMKKIRADLELDYENGVDSQAFYSKEPIQTADTIAKYRLILQRLAKL